MRELNRRFWPYKLEMPRKEIDKDIDNINVWLTNNVGVFRERWNIVEDYSKTDFYFIFQQDMILFSLRWQ